MAESGTGMREQVAAAGSLVAGLGLMAVILIVAFRSTRALLVCLVTVAIALVWTVATVGALGLNLNLVTAIVPPMVLTLGLTKPEGPPPVPYPSLPAAVAVPVRADEPEDIREY